jgi:hypothetical protein
MMRTVVYGYEIELQDAAGLGRDKSAMSWAGADVGPRRGTVRRGSHN